MPPVRTARALSKAGLFLRGVSDDSMIPNECGDPFALGLLVKPSHAAVLVKQHHLSAKERIRGIQMA